MASIILHSENDFLNITYNDIDYCSICVSENNDEEILECGHTFCKECIGEWKKYKKTCPICRFDIIENESDFKIVILKLFDDCNALNCMYERVSVIDKIFVILCTKIGKYVLDKYQQFNNIVYYKLCEFEEFYYYTDIIHDVNKWYYMIYN